MRARRTVTEAAAVAAAAMERRPSPGFETSPRGCTSDEQHTTGPASLAACDLAKLTVQAVEVIDAGADAPPGSPSSVKLTLQDSEHNIRELCLPMAAQDTRDGNPVPSEREGEEEEQQQQQQQQQQHVVVRERPTGFQGGLRSHRHGIPLRAAKVVKIASSAAGKRTERDYFGNERHIYTRDEVAQHATPGDMWLVVHGKVYDASKWMHNHPGGQQAIINRAGGVEDATQDYEFHSERARKLWRSMYIGDLEHSEGGPGRGCPIM